MLPYSQLSLQIKSASECFILYNTTAILFPNTPLTDTDSNYDTGSQFEEQSPFVPGFILQWRKVSKKCFYLHLIVRKFKILLKKLPQYCENCGIYIIAIICRPTVFLCAGFFSHSFVGKVWRAQLHPWEREHQAGVRLAVLYKKSVEGRKQSISNPFLPQMLLQWSKS